MQENLLAAVPDSRVILQCDLSSFNIEALERQIDAEWLSAVLSQRYAGVVVTGVSIIKAIVGFQTKAWVEMTFNDVGQRLGLPNVMIVKSVFDRFEPAMTFSTEMEVVAYRDLKPRYPLNTPECHYSGFGPDHGSSPRNTQL